MVTVCGQGLNVFFPNVILRVPSLPLTVQYGPVRPNPDEAIGDSKRVEHPPLGIAEEQVWHPDHGEMVVVERNALVVILLVGEAGVTPCLAEVHVDGVLL